MDVNSLSGIRDNHSRGNVPGATQLTSATVPDGCLRANYEIRPDKLSVVKKFLIDLGAYPAEADKIISTKSGKTAKMQKGERPHDS